MADLKQPQSEPRRECAPKWCLLRDDPCSAVRVAAQDGWGCACTGCRRVALTSAEKRDSVRDAKCGQCPSNPRNLRPDQCPSPYDVLAAGTVAQRMQRCTALCTICAAQALSRLHRASQVRNRSSLQDRAALFTQARVRMPARTPKHAARAHNRRLQPVCTPLAVASRQATRSHSPHTPRQPTDTWALRAPQCVVQYIAVLRSVHRNAVDVLHDVGWPRCVRDADGVHTTGACPRQVGAGHNPHGLHTSAQDIAFGALGKQRASIKRCRRSTPSHRSVEVSRACVSGVIGTP